MSLRTHLTVVGATASVAENMTFTIDNGNRFSAISVGVALTINNLNGGSSTASGALIWAGGVTATAATAGKRVVAHVQQKHTVIEVVHDTAHYVWGGTNAVSYSSVAGNTTTPTYSAHNLPPCVIGPGQSMVVVEWAALLFAVGAVFVLRRRLPHAPRPFRTPGYPLVPALFLLGTLAGLGAIVWGEIDQPAPNYAPVWGLLLSLAGFPAYALWRRGLDPRVPR